MLLQSSGPKVWEELWEGGCRVGRNFCVQKQPVHWLSIQAEQEDRATGEGSQAPRLEPQAQVGLSFHGGKN